MPINVTNFRVQGLHGHRSISIPIRDNKLVLVGENGSGKTTIINLMYYLLSRQWEKLSSYVFESIEITINGEVLALSREILKASRARDRFRARAKHFSPYPDVVLTKIMDELLARGLPTAPYEVDRLAARISMEYGLPASLAEDYILTLSGEEMTTAERPIFEVGKRMRELVQEQILYLPTYRRIEQDLKTIFPNMEIDHDKLQKRLPRPDGSNYIELVEFGMQDVDKNISDKMSELKEFIRSRLNKLTGSYLREVISGAYKSFKTEDLERISTAALDSIIARIGEDILPDFEKNRMRAILGEIKSKRQVSGDHKVIAHFLLKLIDVYEEQQQKEENIRRFIEVCNQYLKATNKRIDFNNNTFEISIVLADLETSQEDHPTIKMRQLSSGEKQIVSLFSHLFLSGIEEFFVLIDEPDLSLSVMWQQRLLPDILSIAKCTGLVAVTHSPFIFDNELKPFTHSVNEFWTTA
jgi:predicted ATP-binding protein involved in virulence